VEVAQIGGALKIEQQFRSRADAACDVERAQACDGKGESLVHPHGLACNGPGLKKNHTGKTPSGDLD